MEGKKKNILTILVIVVLAVLIVVVALLLRSKSSPKQPVSKSTIGMGTVVVNSFYADKSTAEEAIEKANDIINDLDDNYLSWRKDGSIIAKVNESYEGNLEDITYNCIATCLQVAEDTDGLFDITVGKLTGLWNIGDEKLQRVPSEEEIKEVLPTINYKSVKLGTDAYLVSIKEGQRLDLGAVGKGLACDEIKKYLETTKITGGTSSVGGSILVYGTNPSSSDGSWNVGVRDPFGTDSQYMAIINCGPCCISTSGDYEKTFTENGKTYHHILNPKTGYPAESDITGVTIVCDSGILSDALSTSCFMLGYGEKSLALLKKYDAEGIFVTKDKKVYITSGLKDSVTITNEDYEVVS